MPKPTKKQMADAMPLDRGEAWIGDTFINKQHEGMVLITREQRPRILAWYHHSLLRPDEAVWLDYFGVKPHEAKRPGAT